MALAFAKSAVLQEVMDHAAQSMQIYLNREAPIQFFQAVLSKARGDIAVDLMLTPHTLRQQLITVSYLEQLYRCGGRLFISDRANYTRSSLGRPFVIVDSQRVCSALGPTESGFEKDKVHLLDDPSDVAVYLSHWRGLLEAAYSPSVGLVTSLDWNLEAHAGFGSVLFNARPNRVAKDGSVYLNWSFPNADYVDILPYFKKLPAIGQRTVHLTMDTEISLTAYRTGNWIQKVVSVTVDRALSFEYDLASIDEADGTTELLSQRPELPHHFGCLKGSRIRIGWRSRNATRLTLVGKGQVELTGAYIFTPGDLERIRFEVSNVHEEIHQEIVLKTFAAPDPALTPAAAEANRYKMPARVNNLQLADLQPSSDLEMEFEKLLEGLDETSRATLQRKWRAKQQSERSSWWSSLKQLLNLNPEHG